MQKSEKRVPGGIHFKCIFSNIVVINVRKKILKNVKNVCKRDKKRYPLFLLAFDVKPVDKITDIN